MSRCVNVHHGAVRTRRRAASVAMSWVVVASVVALLTGCRTPSFQPKPTMQNQMVVRPGEVELGVDFGVRARPEAGALPELVFPANLVWRVALTEDLTYSFPTELRWRMAHDDAYELVGVLNADWRFGGIEDTPERSRRRQALPTLGLGTRVMLGEDLGMMASVATGFVTEFYERDRESMVGWYERASWTLNLGAIWQPRPWLFVRPAVLASYDRFPMATLLGAGLAGVRSQREPSLWLGLGSANAGVLSDQPLIQIVIDKGWYVYGRGHLAMDLSADAYVVHEYAVGAGRYF